MNATGSTDETKQMIGALANTKNRHLLDPSGTITLYLRDDCPGTYKVYIYYRVKLSGTGPQGQAKARVAAGYKVLYWNWGTAKADVAHVAVFDAYVGKEWTQVVQYVPTIALPMDRGKRSTAEASGLMEFLAARK